MQAVAAGPASAYAALIVVVLPLRSRSQYKRMLERQQSEPGAKLRFYYRSSARKVLLLAPMAVVGLLAHRSPHSIGLALPTFRSAVAVAMSVVLLVGLALGAFRMRASPASVTRSLATQPRLLEFLPANHEERAAFVVVALSAGVCEELIYRGFAVAYLRWAWPSATTFDICVLRT
ncbi:MAG: hypothetical protein ACLQNG_12865 [Acidimicrobiales bacterium]